MPDKLLNIGNEVGNYTAFKIKMRVVTAYNEFMETFRIQEGQL